MTLASSHTYTKHSPPPCPSDVLETTRVTPGSLEKKLGTQEPCRRNRIRHGHGGRPRRDTHMIGKVK